MKHEKRLAFLLEIISFCIVMIMCGLVGTAAEEEFAEGIWKYILQTDGTAYITGILDTQLSDTLTIPDSIGGCEVTAVKGLNNLQEITKIVIPDGVKEIGENAFYNNTSLMYVELPDSLKVIGDRAFENCPLRKINLPDGLITINSYAFFGCGFPTVRIPETTTYIGDHAFDNSELQYAIFPNTVMTIGDGAFSSAEMREFYISENHPMLASYQGVLFSKTTMTLLCYPKKKTRSIYEVPAGVTAIAPNAFDSNSYICEVILPDTVVSIGNYAFFNCDSLEKINLPDGLQSIGASAFRWTDNLSELTIPASVEEIGEDALPDAPIKVYAGSFAETYCIENELDYVCIDP